MLKADYSSRFKKDLKLMEKRDSDMRKILEVMTMLENEEPLPAARREHPLTGGYSGFLECHIEPDWLLVYKVDSASKTLYFTRTGSHADLF